MKKQTRRSFVATAVTAGTISAASAFSQVTHEKKQLVHHVFFWLINKDSKEDLDALIGGLKSLKQIAQLRIAKIGVPASTEKRDVIDDSYSVSWLNIFDDAKAQQEYQVHPVHLKFVETCKHLWEKVVVYDSQDI
ncbi:MAG TPA: Dabb family protein [Chryseosolibacter sp.]|nr:Dabb family protein [Chryseosolibacter sp.]